MICGIWKFGAGQAEGLDAMLAALPGREADINGRWVEACVALGWRGRAVREAPSERQTCLDATSGVAISASVRLDGRDSLCRALGVPRRDWMEVTDSDLILMSYGRWGRACPEHLLGDFAFALWDAHRETLFCARDHIGARPFYYAHTGERFVFASDVGAVLAAPGVSGELDETTVATRLTYGARPLGGERTWYRAVRRLLPGHVLTVERDTARLERWWRPEETPAAPVATDDVLADACLAVVSEAVRDRLRGTDVVGVHLSGGLDSSGVAALAARELRRQGRPGPPAFAWYPSPSPGPLSAAESAEYGRIEAVCRQEELEVHYRSPEAGDVVGFLRRDRTRDGDEGSFVHEELVRCAAAEQGVRVVLSGWGGDEGISYSGHGYYPQLLRSGQVRRLWRELAERSRHPLASFVSECVLPLVPRGAARAARLLRHGKWPFPKNVTFIDPGFARQARSVPAGGGRPAGVRRIQLQLLQREQLSQRMEAWAGSGARHGIEYRYPLLDRRVLEFALSMQPEQYRRGRWGRWLMRRALDPVLPPDVCWNPTKSDPARFERLRDATAEALPAVRRLIEARSVPPTRSRYVDLPRLLEQLDPERWRASGRFWPVPNALRFLDF